MEAHPPEQRRVKITTDIHSTSHRKLQQLGISHPFTSQVDVLFPSSDVLESALSKLGTRYSRGRVKLSELVDSAGAFANFYLQSERCFTMLSTDANSDDVWCIDPRGLLTLFVAKETYERLGLVGKKLPFKRQTEYYVIRLPLRKNSESVVNTKRRNDALKDWDARRERDGLGPWNVLYCSNDPNLPEPTFAIAQVQDVACQTRKMDDVHIPVPSQHPRPSTSTSSSFALSLPPAFRNSDASADAAEDVDTAEDWNANMAALFEWIGMACLGSQRLKANDRVDPYVALYECPSPSHVGSVTHLRWSGFLGPVFLQSVIDLVIASVKSLPTGSTREGFVAITAHAYSESPVSYIPPSAQTGDGPFRMARKEGEDTWCLCIMPETEDSRTISWALVESLGQYDTRWG